MGFIIDFIVAFITGTVGDAVAKDEPWYVRVVRNLLSLASCSPGALAWLGYVLPSP